MELLKALYAINSKSGKEVALREFVRNILADLDVTMVEDELDNLFITKGRAEAYPCIVAHLDEVHDVDDRQIVVEGDMIYALNSEGERVGLGADDKNGVWIAIQLLRQQPILQVALFAGEEKLGDLAGCRGSRGCSLEHFDKTKYLLQCDRKGASDIVVVGKNEVVLCGEKFFPDEVLQRYGFQRVSGGRTDVVALRERGLSKDCCNISCGYYNAHKTDEYTIFPELQNTLALVTEIVGCL